MSERKCRVCGCTENDCRQCIEKTGEPCTWVAEDLCSACEPQNTGVDMGLDGPPETSKEVEKPIPEEAETPTEVTERKFVSLAEEAAAARGDVPGFFSGLAALSHVDATIRIMQKGDKLTVSILPNAGNQGAVIPVFVTGTPAELDTDLLKQFGPALQQRMQEASKAIASAANTKASDSKPATGETKSKKPNEKNSTKKAAKKAAPAKAAPPKKKAEPKPPPVDKPKQTPVKKAAPAKAPEKPAVVQNALF